MLKSETPSLEQGREPSEELSGRSGAGEGTGEGIGPGEKPIWGKVDDGTARGCSPVHPPLC